MPTAVAVVTFPMSPGHVFDWHTHADHQLAWAATGVLTVRSRVRGLGPAADPRAVDPGWDAPRDVVGQRRHHAVALRQAQPLSHPLGDLHARRGRHAARPAHRLPRARRARPHTAHQRRGGARRPLATGRDDGHRRPDADRAPRQGRRRAALRDPADGRSLAEWGSVVGASDRTLSRAFVADTGVPFGRWRTLLRMRIALASLAAGDPVNNVSRNVGYESPSAFVAAFRKETGVTPSVYFRTTRVAAS